MAGRKEEGGNGRMTAAIVLTVLLLLMLYIAAAGFFRYTFTRLDKTDPWQEDPRFKIVLDRAFFERPDRELLEIKSRDGLRLKAWFYDQGGDTTVILCHGYRGSPEELSGVAGRLYGAGMNVLLIYQRAHGLSEGTYFTMGVKEKQDAADWARKIASIRPAGKIVLFGWSMGGNTVMGAVGEALPENVVCAVEDSGYYDLCKQLLYSCQHVMPRLPAKRFFVEVLSLYCRLFKGFAPREPRGAALSRCRVPVLFIHGGEDRIVPYENLERCYTACAARKLCSSYASAPHVSACGMETERYFAELLGFIEANTNA